MICGFVKYLHIKNNKKLVVLVSNNIFVKVALDVESRAKIRISVHFRT